ncbi:MAG TPA: DUF1819 family protein [Candidatus Eremiobacteraeota bacterium]|nr:DUF1819 family protein [Candidatus Eremiobacteraeota bacterium]
MKDITSATIPYSASLTGEPFLYFEMRETAALILSGLSEEEVKEKIYKENLYQYKTKNRIRKRIAAIKKRLAFLDNYLLKLLSEGLSETGKIITLFTIYKTNRLFYEFMEEVVKEKFILRQDYLEDMDISLFFQRKAEEDETPAAWGESTVKKLKNVIKNILFETDILRRDKTLERKMLHPDLKAHFMDKGERQFLDCLEGL